jgi:large subunit ribosomal protein L13
MKTYSAKPGEVEKKWYVIDAEGVVLGRLASTVANILRGKHKPSYTPHIDCGDHVVIINAEKVALTGRKRADKVYYRHTGYPGGIKSATAAEILDGRFPERVIEKAVERMVPRGPLGRQQLRKLKVYPGSEHPHDAQQPEVLDFASRNAKNVRTA